MAPLSEVRGARNGAGGGVDVVLLAQASIALGEVAHRAEGAAQHAGGPLGLADERGHRRADELGVRSGSARAATAAPAAAPPGASGPGRGTMATTSTPEAPSNSGVVHLGDDGDVAGLEPLDDVHLPQRAVRVEGTAGDVGHEGGQLGRAPRCGKTGPSQVVVEIEVRGPRPTRGDGGRRARAPRAGAGEGPDGCAPPRRRAPGRSTRVARPSLVRTSDARGRTTITATTCMCMVSVSSARKVASSPLRRSITAPRPAPVPPAACARSRPDPGRSRAARPRRPPRTWPPRPPG